METPATKTSIDLTPLPGKQTGAAVQQLVGLMQRLLAPGGCPWDREQTLDTLVPYLVEETYEVVDALAEKSVPDHREELGDLLLQIIFQSELRFTEGAFGIDDVARGIVEKLVRRHPHVFGDVQVSGAEDVLSNWAKLKATEKAEKGKHGALHGIPKSAPALLRATRAGEKAGAVGFDFPDADGPRAKVDEELREFDEARARGDAAEMTRELGDALFALVNLGRKLKLDPEMALRDATDRFAQRFRHIETTLEKDGRAVSSATPGELDRLWEAAKAIEATATARQNTRETGPRPEAVDKSKSG
ncbi:MAG TPA: nucleoside triphosphate pyrophosphohydrolase [Polyangia bacterium]|nr:nucleoside triphosphate pyrophosphohydrolase [Polyangia bacterium]